MGRPNDAASAFVRNDKLVVIDCRGNIFTYDPSIKEDAKGNELVAPADFARAEKGYGDSVLVIDNSGTAWNYDLGTGHWTKGPNVDELQDGEEEQEYNPWKAGHNVGTRVPDEEEEAPKKSRKRSYAHEDA